MHATLTIIFWVSCLGLCFNYLGYPLLMLLAARLCGKRQGVVEAAEANLPSLTVLIAAYNAEQHIAERIRNVLACDYPRDRLDIVVASDGSTDGTVRVVREFHEPRIRVMAFAQRRGKSAVLSDAVTQLQTEVVVFTDATSRFHADSLRQLARHFADPSVGLVTGKVTIVNEHGDPSESLYWRSEMLVRRCEARLGIMLGASGALYALRRRLFVAPRRRVINDDLVLPMLTVLRHGCDFVFDETARACALSSSGRGGEFERRCRIGAGAFQSLPVLREMVHWQHAKQALAFAAHKLLRWVCPFLMVALLASNLALLPSPVYALFMVLQLAAYGLAVLGLVAPQRGLRARVARTAASFLVMNLALLVGFFRWAFDPGNVLWIPTARPLLEATPSMLQDL